jgi:hypothetical protein
MLNAALAGFGLAYVPEDVVRAHLAKGRLKRVLADWCPLYSGYHLYYPSRRQQTPAFALLVEVLRHRQSTEPRHGVGRARAGSALVRSGGRALFTRRTSVIGALRRHSNRAQRATASRSGSGRYTDGRGPAYFLFHMERGDIAILRGPRVVEPRTQSSIPSPSPSIVLIPSNCSRRRIRSASCFASSSRSSSVIRASRSSIREISSRCSTIQPNSLAQSERTHVAPEPEAGTRFD